MAMKNCVCMMLRMGKNNKSKPFKGGGEIDVEKKTKKGSGSNTVI